MKLDDIHNLVIGKVGPEFRNRVACQFEEKLSLLVIVDFREVDKFVYDDIFGRIKDDPAFSNNNINPVFLLPQFLDQNFFGNRLIIKALRIKAEYMKT